MAVKPIHLWNAEGWKALEALLGARQSRPAISAKIIDQLRGLGALTVLVEEDYIDRDFSEAYTTYYAKTFRRHRKLCKRLLFFSERMDFLADMKDVSKAIDNLEEVGKRSFLGWAVLRPISQAPLSQIILKGPPAPSSFEPHCLVKARYTAHLLGIEFVVEGIPMTQQDSRIGACAQAVIWVMARHFNARHRGPWLSTASITNAAIATPDHANNKVLPAGSEFLTGNNMVAALRSAGRETLLYVATGNPLSWGQLRPADIINRYIDSGIPVLVGLGFAGRDIGHAVVATGQVLRPTVSTSLPKFPTRAEFCEAFYVQDDQQGPNIRMPVSPTSSIGETAHYNLIENCQYLMVPLPEKVYLPAEKAEELSWDILTQHSNDWSSIKAKHGSKLGQSESLGDEFVSAFGKNQIIARTYLTYGWKYKHRMMRNSLPNAVRTIIRNLDTPRFLYVTEFYTVNSCSGKAIRDRRIFAHCAVDATAKNQDLDSVLLFHAPGMCMWHAHDDRDEFIRSVAAIKDDTGYFPKIRGDNDFSSYQ
jgi:hypothetical protein